MSKDYTKLDRFIAKHALFREAWGDNYDCDCLSSEGFLCSTCKDFNADTDLYFDESISPEAYLEYLRSRYGAT